MSVRTLALDHYLTLGRSGLRVSPLCLGTMTFGVEWGFGSDEAESVAMISRFRERGGNFFDAANIYTKGHNEVILGDYFSTGAGRGERDRAVIATKFGGNMWPGDPNGGGSNRKSMFSAVDDSLRRLKTDYIDLLWCHFQDVHTPIEETMQSLDMLVKNGKVRYIGFSDHPAWVCVQAQYEANFRSWTPLIALQIEYSLLQRTVEHELMPMARALGLGVTPWSPLRGGVLSGKFDRTHAPKDDGGTRVRSESKYLTEHTFVLVDHLHAIAAAHNATAAQVALRWVMDRAGVTSSIIGTRTLAQLDDNLAACALRLSADETKQLDLLTEPPHVFPTQFLQTISTGIHGGTNINGVAGQPWPLAPQNQSERW
ncbi:MAG: aldo/keto reductase [Planctomycetota bacterium]|jgi:aryl-alcohol dehydrogenase-like predicted oxidoreductase|nr:MAG: aldo/keto reductase [Planctomycetota bacterium]